MIVGIFPRFLAPAVRDSHVWRDTATGSGTHPDGDDFRQRIRANVSLTRRSGTPCNCARLPIQVQAVTRLATSAARSSGGPENPPVTLVSVGMSISLTNRSHTSFESQTLTTSQPPSVGPLRGTTGQREVILQDERRPPPRCTGPSCHLRRSESPRTPFEPPSILPSQLGGYRIELWRAGAAPQSPIVSVPPVSGTG